MTGFSYQKVFTNYIILGGKKHWTSEKNTDLQLPRKRNTDIDRYHMNTKQTNNIHHNDNYRNDRYLMDNTHTNDIHHNDNHRKWQIPHRNWITTNIIVKTTDNERHPIDTTHYRQKTYVIMISTDNDRYPMETEQTNNIHHDDNWTVSIEENNIFHNYSHRQ